MNNREAPGARARQEPQVRCILIPVASTLQEGGPDPSQDQRQAGSQKCVVSVMERPHTPRLALNRPCLSERQGTTGPVHFEPCLALCFLSKVRWLFVGGVRRCSPQQWPRGPGTVCAGRGGRQGDLALRSFMSLSCAHHMGGRAASCHFDPGGYPRY